MSDKVSRRGVYYDVSISPYEYKTPYGEVFKFSSKKKLDMYTRDILKELERFHHLMERNGMTKFIPEEITQLLIKAVYKSFYKKIEEKTWKGKLI